MDALRGVASLGVCLGHLLICNTAFFPDGALKSIGSLGHFGVEIFFVISGFVIPYSLHRVGYRIADWPVFVAKRMLRLEPPYLCTIALVLLLLQAAARAPDYQGEPFHVSVTQIALHLGYINVFFGYPWLLSIFWTLAIEFQYYLLLGLLYPLLVHRKLGLRLAAIAAPAAVALLFPSQAFVFHYWFLFVLGFAAFYSRTELAGGRQFILLLAIAAVGAALTLGWAPAVVGVAAALIIRFAHWRHPFLLFLGTISYSLYLVHLPIGGRIVNLGLRFVHSPLGRIGLLLSAAAGSILTAWLFYRLIERPAQRWSKALRYRRR